MKKFLSIVLFIVFVLQSTSSLWILISFNIQRNYISKNICINRFDKVPVCNGKCYLKKQLRDNENKEQQLPEIKNKEIQLFEPSNWTYFANCQNYINQTEKSYLPLQYFYSSEFLFSVFHPPKLA